MQHKIFVYGSLRRGFGNHRLLETSTYLGERTSANGYTMLHLGGFPGVVEDPEDGGVIEGELYEVDDETLRLLDRLEGHPDFYERKPIDVIDDDGAWEQVEIYLLPEQWLSDGRHSVIGSGNWHDRNQAKRPEYYQL